MTQSGPVILVGHSGSGKTEFAVNFAFWLKENGRNPVVADLDIVNPYFRARALKEEMDAREVPVISSNFEIDFHVDAPALSASLQSCFTGEKLAVVDVGGDGEGAVALARYARFLKERPYQMWIVVNANRLHTGTVEDARTYMEAIETASKLKINGMINATHMLRETKKEDVLKGDRLVRRLSELTDIPIVFTVALDILAPELAEEDLAAPLFPIRLYLRPDWL